MLNLSGCDGYSHCHQHLLNDCRFLGFQVDDLKELRGKNLACWCREGAPCHADALIEMANAPLP